MREIKYKAKNKTLGWKFGTVFYTSNDNMWELVDDNSVFYEVEKETICQFTGLHDKNGKEIYENDIVKKETFYDKPPTYRKETFAKVKWIEKFACFFLVDNDDKIFWELADDRRNIEVVGNKFDNSELLKK